LTTSITASSVIDPRAIEHPVADWTGLVKTDAYPVIDDTGVGEPAVCAWASQHHPKQPSKSA
jgi:hypothetical protein